MTQRSIESIECQLDEEKYRFTNTFWSDTNIIRLVFLLSVLVMILANT